MTQESRLAWLRGVGGSRLLRSSGIYVVTNVFNRSIPFFLLPILTRYLSPADLGRVAMFTVGTSLVVPLVGVCTDGAVSRRYFERKDLDFPNYVANCMYIFCGSAVIVGTVAICFAEWIGGFLELPGNWIWMIVLVSAGRFVSNTLLALWQAQGKAKTYATYFLMQTVATFGLSVLFVVVLDYG